MPIESEQTAGRRTSAFLVQGLEDMADYDLYDVLGELGYGLGAAQN